MKRCQVLHCKLLFSRTVQYMASVLSNRKQRTMHSCVVNASDTHQCLPSFHLPGHSRCLPTEASNFSAHDYDRLHVEASTYISDIHRCPSSLENDDGPSDQTESSLDDTGSMNDQEAYLCNGDLSKGNGGFSNMGRSEDGAQKVMQVCNGDFHFQQASEAGVLKPVKRPFCKRCEKAQSLCICTRLKGIVQNKIKITILQNPKEKHHAVGSARVALLGLENVALIDVPEIYSKETFRIRPKVPGSKRSLAGRGGKKILLQGGKWPAMAHNVVPSEEGILQMKNLLIEICNIQDTHDLQNFSVCANGGGEFVRGGTSPANFMHCQEDTVMKDAVRHKLRPPEEAVCLPNGELPCGHPFNKAVDNSSLCLEEFTALIPPGIALLYPSDKAIELSQCPGTSGKGEIKLPCQLIVLDGTWSKARRIFFENPWLQSLPHYKLSPASPSLYEGVRKQPKPDCLSTLESIVYALKVLEPDTEGLDGLLDVFDSMVEDQRRCKQMKGRWE